MRGKSTFLLGNGQPLRRAGFVTRPLTRFGSPDAVRLAALVWRRGGDRATASGTVLGSAAGKRANPSTPPRGEQRSSGWNSAVQDAGKKGVAAAEPLLNR